MFVTKSFVHEKILNDDAKKNQSIDKIDNVVTQVNTQWFDTYWPTVNKLVIKPLKYARLVELKLEFLTFSFFSSNSILKILIINKYGNRTIQRNYFEGLDTQIGYMISPLLKNFYKKNVWFFIFYISYFLFPIFHITIVWW